VRWLCRDEFRRHKKEKATEQQWQTFAQEWQNYLLMISGGGAAEKGEKLEENMTPEQKIRLQFLEEEARKES
jgi:hypothetical protein